MTPAAHPKPTLLMLILLSALAVLPVSIFPPSLPGLTRAFDADYGIVNLAIAGYAWAAAAVQLIMGPLSDRFGRKPVLLAAVAIFTIASLGCAAAPAISSFLAFRLAQAVIIAGYSVTLAVIRDAWDERDAASVIGYVSVGWALAPILGPVVGGLLDGIYGWRASFLVLAAVGTAVFVFCWAQLSETNVTRTATATGQLRTFPELLGMPRFWAYVLCMSFTTGAFYAFLSAAPLAAKTLFAMPSALIGLYMGSSTAGFMLGSFLAGRYAGRHPPTTTMILGMVVASTGLAIGLVLLGLGVVHEATIFGPCLCFGVGNGLTLAGASAGALSVKPRLAGSASGLAGAMSVAGGAAISLITGTVLTAANSAYALLGIMLLSCLAALVAAYAAFRLEQRKHEQGLSPTS